MISSTKLYCAAACFMFGSIVQIYTFTKTNDIHNSTGIGWGAFAVFLITEC